MAIKVFVTGVTGYVGGDLLSAIASAHPDWELTCLVRNSDKGAAVASQYAKVNLVYGDLDSSELLTEESKKADIVFNLADCDHIGAANAIVKGLQSKTTPAYLIHASGTGNLFYPDVDLGKYGEPSNIEFDDWHGVDQLVSLPDRALHRDVDKIVLAASQGHPNVKTAIVCPPTIYGPGRGPGNTRSIQVYNMVKAHLEGKKGFLVGKGENKWNEVHVHDLSTLFILFGEAAAAGGGKASWNETGYYFAENGVFCWGDVARKLTEIEFEKGLLPSKETFSLEAPEVKAVNPLGPIAWGTNSVGKAIRAKELLGWEPKGRKLWDELSDIVDSEAKSLGLI